MKLTNWLTSPTAEALGWTLIHALWQGFAVVLTIAVLFHLSRQSRAARRYQIGMGGLLTQVLASVGTFGWYYEPRSTSIGTVAVGQPELSLPVSFMATANESWLATAQVFLNAHLTEIVWAWLIGVGIFGLRLIGGWAYVQRLRHTATLPVPAQLLNATARITRQMNVSARLQVTNRVAGPLVVGILKPVVLWPVGLLAGLSAADIDAILAHELAHVRRHDYLLNVLQSTIEVLYFFHPALWWLSARVREEREHCCDDLAVEVIGDARILARALARVEEWQHSRVATPALAMAFASKRQLLLQRVRRMLGVPTRPLMSTNSLAGLTLVTILLLSISVYAVQRVDQQTETPSPPKATRRHTVSSDSEYSMIDNQRIGYVVWKGRKLTATHVARLQRQLNLVMAGKLALDAVKQPDRDILLTIIEKNVAFDAGMKALSEGMAQIDYSTITTSAQPSGSDAQPSDLTDPTAKAETTDSVKANGKWVNISAQYAVRDANPVTADDTTRLGAVQRQLELLTKQLKELMAERQPMADKLSKEIAELAAKNGSFYKQMGPYQGQIGQLAKQQRALAAKLLPLNKEIQQLTRQNSAQAQKLARQKEAQASQFDKQMAEVDAQMAKLTERMEPLTTQLEPYQRRLEILADSIGKLYEPTSSLSEKIGELSEQLSEQVEKQTAEAMRQAEEALDRMDAEDRPARASRMASPARPPRPPRPAKAPKAPKAPRQPDVDLDLAPVPALAPVAAPKPAPAPAVAPRPAPVPKIPKN